MINDKPMFSVSTPFQGVTTIMLNSSMCQMLTGLLSEIEDGVEKELWALKRAIEDPDGCRVHRQNRRVVRRAYPPENNQSENNYSGIQHHHSGYSQNDNFGDFEDERH